MRAFALLFAFFVLCPWSAFALSNADFEKFVKESPAFEQAEANMNDAWGAFSAAASREEFSAVLKEQREWIKKTRDSKAAALMKKDKLSRVEAYIRTALDRTATLNEYTRKSLARVNHASIEGRYGTKDKYVTITRRGENYAVLVHTFEDDKPQPWECNFEGEAPLRGNVLTFEENGDTFTVTVSANNSVATVADMPNNVFCGIRGTANGSFRR